MPAIKKITTICEAYKTSSQKGRFDPTEASKENISPVVKTDCSVGFFKDKSILNIGICTNLCLKNLGFCENIKFKHNCS